VSVNQIFEKIWEIQNTGKVEWKERFLQCMDEDIVSVNNDERTPVYSLMLFPLEMKIPIPTTKPGKTVQIAVTFRAPAFPCTTISYWKMVDHNGDICFPGLEGIWCLVKVMSL
jgi:hypothetical protein